MTWHALASYRQGKAIKPAIVLGDRLFDLAELAKRTNADALLPVAGSISSILANWDAAEPALAKMANSAPDLKPVDATPLAPFEPYRLFCAASNYIEHAAEMATKLAAKADSSPFIFMKSQTSVIGTGEAIMLPPESKQVDWEVELGVVIGRPGRRISVAAAEKHIAGYLVVNDISARDLTKRSDFPFSHDWFRGKSFDTFTPMGPWFVPRSCIGNPHDLALTLKVNDEMMQNGRTGDMIFNIFEQIAYLSTLVTLRPGDVVSTGTPAGVGMGRGIFLKPGDRVTAAIAGVGEISNPVVAEAI